MIVTTGTALTKDPSRSTILELMNKYCNWKVYNKNSLQIFDTDENELSIDDFTEIGKRVPVVADLKPSGKFEMAPLVDIGGTVPLMKMLLKGGLLHGDCLTVTGRTMAENLANSDLEYPDDQVIIRPLDNPIKADSHLRILYGNIALELQVEVYSEAILCFISTADRTSSCI